MASKVSEPHSYHSEDAGANRQSIKNVRRNVPVYCLPGSVPTAGKDFGRQSISMPVPFNLP
jgi:hypothetical protein